MSNDGTRMLTADHNEKSSVLEQDAYTREPHTAEPDTSEAKPSKKFSIDRLLDLTWEDIQSRYRAFIELTDSHYSRWMSQ